MFLQIWKTRSVRVFQRNEEDGEKIGWIEKHEFLNLKIPQRGKVAF